MGVRDHLLNIGQGLRERIEKSLGYDADRVSTEVRQEILDKVESKILPVENGRSFPYRKAMVRLQPTSKALSKSFDKAFLEDKSLKTEIMGKLNESKVQYPENLEIVVELNDDLQTAQTADSHRSLFRLDFVKSDSLFKKEIPETYLVVSKGLAEQPAYRLKNERILIGRLSEVTDREGRLVRKNDVVFLDNEDDINSTVGRIHARIWFDFEKQEFRIMDEISRYGTRILRDGRYLEIPGGNHRGVRLRSGDEIFCGQACVRFEFVPTAAGTQTESAGSFPPQTPNSDSSTPTK